MALMEVLWERDCQKSSGKATAKSLDLLQVAWDTDTTLIRKPCFEETNDCAAWHYIHLSGGMIKWIIGPRDY